MSKIVFGEKPEVDLGYRDAGHAPCIVAQCYEKIERGADEPYNELSSDGM